MDSKRKNSKAKRKQNRCRQIIANELCINYCDEPSPIIAVCNAGLTTGLQLEYLILEAGKYGKISEIFMLPNKSYCFIYCENKEDAQNIFNALHGKSKLGQNQNILYLSYFKSLPNFESIWHRKQPNGIQIIENFINENEERELVDFLQKNGYKGQMNGLLRQRTVKHFGYEFLYNSNNVDISQPIDNGIPSEFEFLWKKLESSVPSLKWFKPDQITMNNYYPGQGIPQHCDTHSAFEDPILSLSLESDIVIEFCNEKLGKVPILLPRRSLLIMSKESRYEWTHGITSRMTDVVLKQNNTLMVQERKMRTSLTFRKLRKISCECGYEKLCDSMQKNNKIFSEISFNQAVRIEDKNVHEVYEKIASHFSNTRHTPWPKVKNFIENFLPGSILLDIGCGNGKYLGINQSIIKLGCDRSEALVKICKERNFHAFKCDCLALPLRDGSVDGCICIAVIHHLSTKERRIKSLEEIARILAPGGTSLIYVWAKNQEFDSQKSSYLKGNNNLYNKNLNSNVSIEKICENNTYLTVHENKTQFKEQDILVPWKLRGQTSNQNKTFLRYYHVFEENELENLCHLVKDIKIQSSYYDQGNWCVIIEKVSNC